MKDTKRTTQLSSDVFGTCEHCGFSASEHQYFQDSVNHYIEEHGYRLLHVGTETSHGPDGKPWDRTVAVLGHDDPPALAPPPKIVVRTTTET